MVARVGGGAYLAVHAAASLPTREARADWQFVCVILVGLLRVCSSNLAMFTSGLKKGAGTVTI